MLKYNDVVEPTESWGSNTGNIPATAIVFKAFPPDEEEGIAEYEILTSDNRKLIVYDYEIRPLLNAMPC